MHEASLIKGLLKQVEDIVVSERASRAIGITVTLGALSHFSPEHFQEHFDHESPGTRAEGARLHVTLDTDPAAPHAQGVWLESVEVAE